MNAFIALGFSLVIAFALSGIVFLWIARTDECGCGMCVPPEQDEDDEDDDQDEIEVDDGQIRDEQNFYRNHDRG